MPASNRLSFLRPLYDIAVWQFILMLGFVKKPKRNTSGLKFTWKMHEVVANFVCKLLDARPFDHLKAKMEEEEVKTATEGWKPGEREQLKEWLSGAKINGEEKAQRTQQRTVPSPLTSPVPCLGLTTSQCASIVVSLAPSVEANFVRIYQWKCLRPMPFWTSTKSTRTWMTAKKRQCHRPMFPRVNQAR